MNCNYYPLTTLHFLKMPVISPFQELVKQALFTEPLRIYQICLEMIKS